MALHAEATSELPGVEVGGVLYFVLFSDLVLDVVPVLAFDMLENYVIIGPVKVFVLFLLLSCDVLKIFESVSTQILIERHALGQLLEDLVSGRHFLIAVDVERQRGLERFGWNDLDAAVVMRVML